MNLTIPERRLHKPKRVVGIDWSHAASRGLRACIPMVEVAGRPMEYVLRRITDVPIDTTRSPYGTAMPTANGSADIFGSFGDGPLYDTPNDLTAATLMDVRSWSTATSGDFWFGKNTFQTRGWVLLNNGAFGGEVGFRTDSAPTNFTYAYASRGAVGTGVMLFVGRRIGTTIEFITINADGLTTWMSTSEGGATMGAPAGSPLTIGTTNANGDVHVLSCWLWDYAVPNAILTDLFDQPWSMLQVDMMRTRFVIYRPVSQTFTSLVEAKQGVAADKTSLVEAWQNLTIAKTMPVDAAGFVSRAISTPVEAGGSVFKSFTSLVEAKGGVSQSFSSLVEAKGSVFFSTWPASLPWRPLLDGWRETMPKTGARSAMDKFPQTQIQRSRAGTWTLNQTIQVTSEELDTLWTFYEDTLGHGAIMFTVTHPLTQSVVRMRFRGGEVPQATPIGWNTYHVSLPLEVMP